MPRYRTAYPPEFRRQMVDLVRSGRTPEELAHEFEPTAQSICTWVKRAERDAGKRIDGPTSAERGSNLSARRPAPSGRSDRDGEGQRVTDDHPVAACGHPPPARRFLVPGSDGPELGARREREL